MSVSQDEIRSILRNERWYGDGPPSWDACLPSGRALEERMRLAKRLRRFAAATTNAAALAEKLGQCAPTMRCLSAACPECTRALQRWMVENITRISAAAERSQALGELLAISLVSSIFQSEYGSLDRVEFKAFTRDVHAAIENSSAVQWAIFGIDISWNEQIQKGLGCYWQYQLYGNALVDDRYALWRTLRPSFDRCITVPRPVMFDNYDGSALGASYVFKVQFYRRISYWHHQADRPCWGVSYRALKAKQAVELALAFDQAGLASRLLSYRLRVSANKNRLQLT